MVGIDVGLHLIQVAALHMEQLPTAQALQMEVLPALEREAVEREAPVCRALQDPV